MKRQFKTIEKRCKPLVTRDNNQLIVHHKGSLYILDSINGIKTKLCSLPMSTINHFLIWFRIFERMFRLEPRVAICLNNDNILLVYQRGMYRVNMNDGSLVLEHRYGEGISNPLDICHIKGITGFRECIAHGEYSGNTGKKSVSIYIRGMNIDDGWEKAYEFPEKTITHIHSIISDPYRNSVIILTGDEDHESGIWVANNNFKEVTPLLIGKQQYRACCAYPLPEGVLYATDSPLETNHICLMKKGGSEWQSEKLVELNGSCIYSTFWNNKFIFSTTVEPDSNIKGSKYLITNKLGLGIKNRQVEIIAGNLNSGFECINSFEKDFLPMALFQFGSVQFCKGNNSKELYIYPVAVKKYDGDLVVLMEEKN